jgi:osmotically-inducible protein OsmY
VERFEVDVDVVGNTAYLSGSVDSYFEKGQADDIAARIEGITNVVNTIDVRGDAALAYDPYVYDDYIYETDWYDFEPVKTFQTDAAIKESINDELWWSPFIEADEVDVSVENGVATLSGQVDSWSEWNAATENAYEAGASWVVNDLEVK